MSPATAVVTGATSGVGREVARLLGRRGWRVLGIGRSAERCRHVQEELRASTGNPHVEILPADLSSLEEIRRVADDIKARVPRVDALVNNAGLFTLRRTLSVDGIEMQLAVNWLAAFALTGRLWELLESSPGARIVNVSSGSHYAGRLHWDDLGLGRGYNGLKAYDQSKLALVLFTAEMARRFSGTGAPVSAAVDPGLVKTDIGAKGTHPLVRLAWKIRTRKGIPAARAAESVVWCATDESVSARSGRYWKECRELVPSAAARDPVAARRLWQIGEDHSGVRWPPASSSEGSVVHAAEA